MKLQGAWMYMLLTGMAAGMADLLTGLLISLLTAQTVQLNGKSAVFVFVGL